MENKLKIEEECGQAREEEQKMSKSIQDYKDTMKLIKLKMNKADTLIRQYNDKMKECDNLNEELSVAKVEKQDILNKYNITMEKLARLELESTDNKQSIESYKILNEKQQIKLQENEKHINQLVFKIESIEEQCKVLEEEKKNFQNDIKLVKKLKTAVELKQQSSQTVSPKMQDVSMNTDPINTCTPKKPQMRDKSIMTNDTNVNSKEKKEPFSIFCSKCKGHVDPAPVDQILKIMSSRPPFLSEHLSPPNSPTKAITASHIVDQTDSINEAIDVPDPPIPLIDDKRLVAPLIINKKSNHTIKTLEESNSCSFMEIDKLSRKIRKLEMLMKKKKNKKDSACCHQNCCSSKNIKFIVQLPNEDKLYKTKKREKHKIKRLNQHSKSISLKEKKNVNKGKWKIEMQSNNSVQQCVSRSQETIVPLKNSNNASNKGDYYCREIDAKKQDQVFNLPEQIEINKHSTNTMDLTKELKDTKTNEENKNLYDNHGLLNKPSTSYLLTVSETKAVSHKQRKSDDISSKLENEKEVAVNFKTVNMKNVNILNAEESKVYEKKAVENVNLENNLPHQSFYNKFSNDKCNNAITNKENIKTKEKNSMDNASILTTTSNSNFISDLEEVGIVNNKNNDEAIVNYLEKSCEVLKRSELTENDNQSNSSSVTILERNSIPLKLSNTDLNINGIELENNHKDALEQATGNNYENNILIKKLSSDTADLIPYEIHTSEVSDNVIKEKERANEVNFVTKDNSLNSSHIVNVSVESVKNWNDMCISNNEEFIESHITHQSSNDSFNINKSLPLEEITKVVKENTANNSILVKDSTSFMTSENSSALNSSCFLNGIEQEKSDKVLTHFTAKISNINNCHRLPGITADFGGCKEAVTEVVKDSKTYSRVQSYENELGIIKDKNTLNENISLAKPSECNVCLLFGSVCEKCDDSNNSILSDDSISMKRCRRASVSDQKTSRPTSRKALLSNIRNVKKNAKSTLNKIQTSVSEIDDTVLVSSSIDLMSDVNKSIDNTPIYTPGKRKRIAHTPKIYDIVQKFDLKNDITNEKLIKKINVTTTQQQVETNDKVSSIIEQMNVCHKPESKNFCTLKIKPNNLVESVSFKNLISNESNISTSTLSKENLFKKDSFTDLLINNTSIDSIDSIKINNSEEEISDLNSSCDPISSLSIHDSDSNDVSKVKYLGKRGCKRKLNSIDNEEKSPVRELRSRQVVINKQTPRQRKLKVENKLLLSNKTACDISNSTIVSYLTEYITKPADRKVYKTTKRIEDLKKSQKFIYKQLRVLMSTDKWTKELNSQVRMNLISSQNFRTIAVYIIDYAIEKCNDELEQFDKSHTPPAPMMTRTEQKLVTLILSIDKEFLGFSDLIIKGIQYKLFRLCPAQQVQIVERLFRILVVLNKIKKDREKVRIFCCDALYCLNIRAINIIYVALTCWPEILPKHSSNNDIIVKTIVHIVMTLEVNQPYAKLSSLRKLLSTYYEYPNSGYITNDFKEELIKNLQENVPGINTAILLLCKKLGPKWSLEHIIKGGLNQMIVNQTHPSLYEAFNLLGHILRSFPTSDSTNSVGEIIDQLCDILAVNAGSDDLQEGVLSSLLSISKFKYEQVAQTVIKWQSNKDIRPATREKLNTFFKQQDSKWWHQFINNLSSLK